MRLKLCCFFLLYVGRTLADVLEDNSDDLDPISHTEDPEDNDQSKRFLFNDDSNKYAWEKHVRFHGGQKYLLGYKPVRLQYMPVAKPLYSYNRRPMRFQGYHRQNLKQRHQPLVSLAPPKFNPMYKLPVNVPASAPQKLWETQGWDVRPTYGPPGYVPSPPEPTPTSPPIVEPSIPIVPPVVEPTPIHPNIPSPIQPVIPTPVQPVVPTSIQPVLPTHIPIHPTVNVLPHPGITQVHFLHRPAFALPVNPVIPIPSPTPILPPPQPSFVPLPASAPVHPPVLIPRPLLLPAKPDLGVLPLGATVPVQLSQQNPQFIQKQPQVLFHQHPHIHFHEPQVIHKVPAVHLEGGFSPIPPSSAVVPHEHGVVNVQANAIHPNPHNFVHHVHPNFVHHIQPNPVPSNAVPQPSVFHQIPPQGLPNFAPAQPSETPNSVPLDQPGVVQQEQPHNYFYFARKLPTQNTHINDQLGDFGQQQVQPQINYDQSFQHASQQQEQPFEENNGYLQPGQSDLQIPDYLPQHPHFGQEQQQLEYQDNYEQGQKRKR